MSLFPRNAKLQRGAKDPFAKNIERLKKNTTPVRSADKDLEELTVDLTSQSINGVNHGTSYLDKSDTGTGGC